MSQYEDHSDDTALAGEYVLHLLEAEARATFEARLASEPALRDLVRDWEAQLGPLAEQVAPVAPPARVKARLDRTLFAPTPKRAAPLWAWVTGGLVAASLTLGVVTFGPALLWDVPQTPTYTASVAAEDGTLVVAARFISETGALELVREAGAARPGRVLELWLIAEGAAAPVSLGVLSEAVETQVTLSPETAEKLANGLLAISDEPPGGSPTGAPTGDVLAVGPLTDV